MQNGDYITFIDADDYIDLEYLAILYKNTAGGQVDYIKSNIVRIKNKNKISINIEEEKIYTQKEEGHDFNILYEKILNTYELNNITATLIKREKINNKFKEQYNYAEDYLFNIEVIKNIDTFKYINYTGYYYRENINSLTQKFNKDLFVSKLSMAINAYKELYILFPTSKKLVDKRINKEVKHILDTLFYVRNNVKLKERLEIYCIINKILNKQREFFNSFDLRLIINEHYFAYDFKNYITKKVPRKIKYVILNKVIKFN